MNDKEITIEDKPVELINITREDLADGIPDPRGEVANLKPEPSESPESFAKRRYELFYERIRQINGSQIGIPFDKLPGKIKKEWIEGARLAIGRTPVAVNPHARKFTTKTEALQRKRGRVPR